MGSDAGVELVFELVEQVELVELDPLWLGMF